MSSMGLHCILIFFVLTISLSFSNAGFFSTRNLTSLAGKGSSFTLTCTFHGPYSYILWVKDGNRLQDSDRIAGSKAETLHVQDIVIEDEGTYVCQIVHGRQTSRGRFFIHVREAPYFISEPKSQTVEIGKTVTIPCKGSGKPEPKLFWIGGEGASPAKPPRITIKDDGTLVIKDFKKSDAGQYTCLARNSYGSARKQILIYARSNGGAVITPFRTLTYYSKGPQFVKTPSVITNLDAGLDHTFACSASGDPTPNITIAKLYKKVKSTPGEAKMVLKNATISDSGQYECKASNYFGVVRYVFAVRIKIDGGFSIWSNWTKCSRACGQGLQYRSRKCDNPKPQNGGKPCYGRYSQTRTCVLQACEFPKITMMSYDIRDADKLKLECHAHGVPKPRLRWKYNSTPLPYRGNRIAIPSRFARSGHYFCEARNLLGYSSVSIRLRL